MPQFDFYSWPAACFWTITFFQYFYCFLLYYIIKFLSEIQKTVQKIKLFYTNKTIHLTMFFYNLYLNKKVAK